MTLYAQVKTMLDKHPDLTTAEIFDAIKVEWRFASPVWLRKSITENRYSIKRRKKK